MEKISWTNRVRNEEVLYRDKKKKNILHTVKKKEGYLDWSYLARKWPLKHIIEGKIEGRLEVAGRRRRGRRKLLDA